MDSPSKGYEEPKFPFTPKLKTYNILSKNNKRDSKKENFAFERASLTGCWDLYIILFNEFSRFLLKDVSSQTFLLHNLVEVGGFNRL